MAITSQVLQLLALLLVAALLGEGSSPIVINTWNFTDSTAKAWSVLKDEDGSAVDAVERGCTICEELQCDGSVGFGGSPDENGETTQDAMIMDGTTHDVGAVGALRRVKSAISVARKVMEHTTHTLLVGDQATEFALMMGFKEENLTTNSSTQMYKKWKNLSCQPNYWKNVLPDPKTSCGPYVPNEEKGRDFKWFTAREGKNFNVINHDTIGMIVIDKRGSISGGTSTNGASHKVPGRVGDSPIPGSGAYVDKHIGGAAATGDGDVMMRFMPALITVEFMRSGLAPHKAAELALQNIASYYPNFLGAVIAVTLKGEYGAACYGFEKFPYSVINSELKTVTVKTVPCFT